MDDNTHTVLQHTFADMPADAKSALILGHNMEPLVPQSSYFETRLISKRFRSLNRQVVCQSIYGRVLPDRKENITY